MVYNIFGSADSIDCDAMVFVNKIGTVAESKAEIERLVQILQPSYDKEINVNLAVLSDGIVSEVFKGTTDEVNNSLLATYALHSQVHPIQVHYKVDRNVGLKALRSMRAILSFISRTQYRMAIKDALRGTATDKYELLKALTFSSITDLQHKNISFIDFYKTLAFQMGQSYLLNTGTEVYTKQDIGFHCQALEPFLQRVSDTNPFILDDFKITWLNSFDPSTVPTFEELRK